MHTLRFETKFTFGEYVSFSSRTQNLTGKGRIFAITIDADGNIDYIIEVNRGDYSDYQPGILPDEIARIEA